MTAFGARLYWHLGFDIRDYPQAYRMFENEITLLLNII